VNPDLWSRYVNANPPSVPNLPGHSNNVLQLTKAGLVVIGNANLPVSS
jgi:hypothetical protein